MLKPLLDILPTTGEEMTRPTKLYRGTETGTAGLKRVSHGGEMGSGIFATPHRWLAASYGGGPKAREGKGRTVHEINIPRLPHHQYGYIHGGLKRDEKAKLHDHMGRVLHEYEPLKMGAEHEKERNQIAHIAKAHGIRVLIGKKDSIGENQVSILDPELIK